MVALIGDQLAAARAIGRIALACGVGAAEAHAREIWAGIVEYQSLPPDPRIRPALPPAVK